MSNQLLELKIKCIGCGNKIYKDEEPFCLICEKIIYDEYLYEVEKWNSKIIV